MDGWEKKKVLMFVKTYPTPSAKYHETVCTAGITETGEWIRIYPIRFRYLKPSQKFEKYTWIEIEVKKNTQDTRPESYRANTDSIRTLRKLDPKDNLEERKKCILPLCKKSFEVIKEEYEQSQYSLGLFRPKKVIDFVIEPSEKEWTEKQQSILNQSSLFDTQDIKLLEKIPWNFSYKFVCDDPKCNTIHNLKITDWELYQAFRKFRDIYKTEKIALQKLKDKYFGFFNDPEKESYLIVGTVHPFPTFIVIGVFSYKKNKGDSQLKFY